MSRDKPKVFVTRVLPDAGLDLICAACDADIWPEETPIPQAVLLERVRGIEGLVCLLSDRIDAEVIDAAGPGLKVIAQYAVGYDNVDVKEAARRGIAVGNTPGVLTETTAELAFSLLMAAARRLVEGMDYVRAGKWRTWGPKLLRGRDLYGATLGIVGLGRIGRAVARRARGFDMRVLAYNPRKETSEWAELVPLEKLLRESDFVSLHVPLTDETHGLIGADAFALMKPTAVLVNTARGGVVDTGALVEALRSGAIGYAALDVTDPEPLPADHPLLELPNAIVVPHIGSASMATRDEMAVMTAQNLLAGLRGEPLPNPVVS